MPDSLMLYLFISSINENIRFAQMEKKGNEYQRPLEELLELIPQHRALAQRAFGDVRTMITHAGDQSNLPKSSGEVSGGVATTNFSNNRPRPLALSARCSSW